MNRATSGVAVKFYHAARQTDDVDLFVGADPEVIGRMVAGIADLAADPQAVAKLLDIKVGHFKVSGSHQIDVLSYAPGLEFDEAYQTAEILKIGGVVIPVLSKTLLIRHKQTVGEAKDLADVALLQAD